MLIRFRNYLLPYSPNLHFILWQSTRSRVKTSSGFSATFKIIDSHPTIQNVTETGARPIFLLIPREFHGTPSLALATASSSTSEGRRTTAAEDEAQKQQSASEDDETAKSNPTTDSSSNIAGQQQEVIAKRKQQRSKQQKLGRREVLISDGYLQVS